MAPARACGCEPCGRLDTQSIAHRCVRQDFRSTNPTSIGSFHAHCLNLSADPIHVKADSRACMVLAAICAAQRNSELMIFEQSKSVDGAS